MLTISVELVPDGPYPHQANHGMSVPPTKASRRPQIACTNWKRVMQVLDGKGDPKNLYAISHPAAHKRDNLHFMTQPGVRRSSQMFLHRQCPCAKPH